MERQVAYAVLQLLGVLPADFQEEDMAEKERIDTIEVDNFVYRFQYPDGSAFQIYEDGRCIKLAKGSLEGDEEYGAIINRIPARIAEAAALGYQEGITSAEEAHRIANEARDLQAMVDAERLSDANRFDPVMEYPGSYGALSSKDRTRG